MARFGMHKIYMKTMTTAFILTLLTSCTANQALNHTKKETEKIMQKEEIVLINHNQEKIFFGTLKIKFASFSHEHSSSSPNEPFAASTGVYTFNVRDEKNETQITIYTNAVGRSNPEKIFNKYELTLESATSDQKTLKISLLRLPEAK